MIALQLEYIKELVEDAFGETMPSFNEELLYRAIAIARQASLEGSHVFSKYEEWFKVAHKARVLIKKQYILSFVCYLLFLIRKCLGMFRIALFKTRNVSCSSLSVSLICCHTIHHTVWGYNKYWTTAVIVLCLCTIGTLTTSSKEAAQMSFYGCRILTASTSKTKWTKCQWGQENKTLTLLKNALIVSGANCCGIFWTEYMWHNWSVFD